MSWGKPACSFLFGSRVLRNSHADTDLANTKIISYLYEQKSVLERLRAEKSVILFIDWLLMLQEEYDKINAAI